MFRFGLIVEVGSVECVMLGCTFLLWLCFWTCLRHESGHTSVTAGGAMGVPEPSPAALCALVPEGQHCVSCQARACVADVDGRRVREGQELGKGEARMEKLGDMAGNNLDDSAWILKQYYSGLGEEAEDNISNYSAK